VTIIPAAGAWPVTPPAYHHPVGECALGAAAGPPATTRARLAAAPGRARPDHRWRAALCQGVRTGAEPAGGEPHVNYMLIMKNEQSALMAIGPVSIEYQAAMLRDEIEESSNWTTLGIARILSEEQARSAIGAARQ
jgi:hypothetical protein